MSRSCSYIEEFHTSFIEQLRVKIPWSSLSTNPTEVHIDGFYLLIVSKKGALCSFEEKQILENSLFIFFRIEMTQDLTEHYVDKSKRVQQKLNNLRKAALGS